MAGRSASLLRVVLEAIPKALSSPCGGGFVSCRRISAQVVAVEWVCSPATPESGQLQRRTLNRSEPRERGRTEEARNKERLWREFFSDPSQWWDNRFDKKSSRSPDFRHKRTKEVLWVDGASNPSWVTPKLISMVKSRNECVEQGPVEAMAVDSSDATSKDWLWQRFFSDPEEWWDNRFDKKSPNSPDFKHKRTRDVLWVDGRSNPPWVKAELAAMIKCGVLSADGVTAPRAPPDHDYYGMTDFDLEEFFELDILPMTPASYNGPMEGFNKNSSGTFVDVMTLCKAGQLQEALHALNHQGTSVDSYTYVCLSQECVKVKDLHMGKQLHNHIIQSGFKPNIFLHNTLVNMYSKCGSVVDARQLFDKMPERDVCTWTTMVTGYAKHGDSRAALEMYEKMIREGVMPNSVTFTCVLNACADVGALEKGREVHADVRKSEIASDVILETALADMYCKCGSIKDAREVFDSMTHRNVVSWSTMIAGYTQHGCARLALEMYEQMIEEGVASNRVTFMSVLKACASLGDLGKAKEVHADISKNGIVPDIILENILVDMYAKCRSMKDARQVFDSMAQHNVFSWSAMIAGYAHNGCGREAVKMYEQMQRVGVTPDRVMFCCILDACGHFAALQKGEEVHDDIWKAGLASDTAVETALVKMYAKCGSMKKARQVFDNMAQRDVSSWSAMMTGYTQHGCAMDALQLFQQMQQEGLKPDDITFLAEHATKEILRSDPQDTEAYVLLSNIYTAAGRWNDQAKVRKMMKEKFSKTSPGAAASRWTTAHTVDKSHLQFTNPY